MICSRRGSSTPPLLPRPLGDPARQGPQLRLALTPTRPPTRPLSQDRRPARRPPVIDRDHRTSPGMTRKRGPPRGPCRTPYSIYCSWAVQPISSASSRPNCTEASFPNQAVGTRPSSELPPGHGGCGVIVTTARKFTHVQAGRRDASCCTPPPGSCAVIVAPASRPRPGSTRPVRPRQAEYRTAA
jgi:hypothetical protein